MVAVQMHRKRVLPARLRKRCPPGTKFVRVESFECGVKSLINAV